MKMLNKFVLKNLLLNKKRTIVTIIGIMLSTALICAVAGMVTSTQQTMINTVINDDGNYHLSLKGVKGSDVANIQNSDGIETSYLVATEGISKIQQAKNIFKPYICIMQYDELALKNNAVKLIEGRLPQSENEIVISNYLQTQSGVGYEIGDEIELDIGRRTTSNNEALTNGDSYVEGELLVELKTKKYTIVGIMERTNYYMEEYNSPCYTVISKMQEDINDEKEYTLFVRYTNVTKMAEINEQIFGEECSYETHVNRELMRYEGALSDSSLSSLIGIAVVVIIIIVVSSVFVIRNSFAISVSEKNKQFGMLSSIGATPRQIRKTVLMEGLFIGAIAIPLGILLGMLAVVILIFILNSLLATMLNGVTFVYSIPILPIMFSIVLGVITICLSSVIPAIKAAKISPVESIRGNNDVKLKAKKIKTSKMVQKLLGIGGVIASKNLKRSKKKYRTTIISLVVSIVIFISLSSFLEYGKKLSNIYYTEINCNLIVQFSDNNKLYDDIEKMLKIEGITDYAREYETYGHYDTKYATDFSKQMNKNIEQSTKGLDVVIVNKEYYAKYLEKIGCKSKGNAVVIDEYIEQKQDKKVLHNLLNISTEDSFNVTINDENYEFEIAMKTDTRPMGYEGYNSENIMIVVSEEVLSSTIANRQAVYINAEHADIIETKLLEIINNDTNYSSAQVTNIETYVEQVNRLYLIIGIFLYGFIIVITLIGVTNIFNTITTNMFLRSREFAMLKSIGMTTKEFNRMIRLESIMYGMKSLLIGIPIGLIGSYALYLSFGETVEMGYIWPFSAILISVLAVFLIVALTMKYSLNRLNKQNIIDTIRQENV